MQDIELMHMWYALDLAVLAVGNHLEAVNDIPRKFITELDHALSDGVSRGGRQALEWRASIAKHLKSGNGSCQFCSVFFRYLNASGSGKRH
ncbi:hypothetical protein CerSpe_195380 [Prunus speciosa]